MQDESPADQDNQRQARRAQAGQLLDRLIETYPDVFAGRGASTARPLKLGIHRDLATATQEWGFPGPVLRLALTLYIRQLRYQMALAAGGARYGLDAQPDGEVSEEHRTVAAAKVEEIQQRRKALRDARKPAPRERQAARARSTDGAAAPAQSPGPARKRPQRERGARRDRGSERPPRAAREPRPVATPPVTEAPVFAPDATIEDRLAALQARFSRKGGA